MHSKPSSASVLSVVAPRLRRIEYISLVWENELLPCAEIAAVERCAARALVGRGFVIAPWHGRLPAARAALAARQVDWIDGGLPVRLGPGASREVRVLLAEPAGRQPILFVALDGFFQGERSPYDTTALKADTLAFALAADALLAAARPDGGTFIWAREWETVPAMLLLRARHATALHLHSIHDAEIDGALRGFDYPRADELDRGTVLQAGLGAADVIAAANPAFAAALRDPEWPVYTHVLAGHLQGALGRLAVVSNGPLAEMRPEWRALREALAAEAHAAGRIFAAGVLPARHAVLAPALCRLISSRMIVLVDGRSTERLPEVAIAAARRVLTGGDFRGFFVFAPRPGDAYSTIRHARLAALQHEFPRDVLVIENDAELLAAASLVANAQVFTAGWDPHGAVLQGPVVPIAFGEGAAAWISPWRVHGAAARWPARFHAGEEPRNGFWLHPPVSQPAALTVENWRAMVAAPPEPGNRVFDAMVEELVKALRMVTHCWSNDPIAFAALVFGALCAQEGRDWAARDRHGRMFELMAAVRRT